MKVKSTQWVIADNRGKEREGEYDTPAEAAVALERMKTACAFIGDCAFIALVVSLVWAYCKVTPDQLSGEADLSVQACEDAGVEYAHAYSGKAVR